MSDNPLMMADDVRYVRSLAFVSRLMGHDEDAALYDRILATQENAERWRVVAPTLTVRNEALDVMFDPRTTYEPCRGWSKSWLESRKPLDGVALTVEQYADALRKLAATPTGEQGETP